MIVINIPPHFCRLNNDHYWELHTTPTSSQSSISRVLPVLLGIYFIFSFWIPCGLTPQWLFSYMDIFCLWNYFLRTIFQEYFSLSYTVSELSQQLHLLSCRDSGSQFAPVFFLLAQLPPERLPGVLPGEAGSYAPELCSYGPRSVVTFYCCKPLACLTPLLDFSVLLSSAE